MKMKEEDACSDRRSWEEQIYWNHFQSLHFSQCLYAGFNRELAIPEHFTKNLKRKLPSTVTLKSPCGTEWEVGLTTKENTTFFSLGWQEFVKDHSLQENDIMIFKYNGESCFDILAFDGRSMCERGASYFLRKCTHRGQGAGCHIKISGESSGEAGNVDPLPEKLTKKNAYTKSWGQQLNSRMGNKKVGREINYTKPVITTNAARNKELHTWGEDVETKPEIENTCSSVSGRRSITEEDERRVLRLAHSVLSSEGFLVAMKPTHVCRKFYLNVPWKWLTKHLGSRKKADVILRAEEKAWRAQAAIYLKKYNQCTGGIGGGWRKFVMDNNLQLFDVCVFEPSSTQMNNSIVLDVSIFRVV